MSSSIIDIKAIKLIIWDLDDTLWNGTLSEGEVNMPPSHISLVNNITDSGVINSICSKNNEAEVVRELEKLGIAEHFVFKSINWDSKGRRVQQIVTDMSLRNVNVLFVDDNISNLKEVEFCNPGIMIATPQLIPNLIDFFNQCQKKDIEHKRLKQYKILEQKRNESTSYISNEEFLRSCNITLQINHNCKDQACRLHELSLRTNQLNFTKKRLNFEEFTKILDQCECGYITVQDRFGDYGIVGFYAINKTNELEHFFFSCRTIGQGIEQYVYWKLGFPALNIIGEVASPLDNKTKPNWIAESNHITQTPDSQCSDNILCDPIFLFKGPCDMSSMVGYLQLGNNVKTEFTFTDDLGRSIENHNHSAHIFGLKTFSEEQLKTLQSECFFINQDNFNSDIFNHNYKIIFLSTLIEGNYGLYRRKGSNEIVAYGHYDYPLTDTNYWDMYINQTIPTYNYTITLEDLKLFATKYEYVGRTNPDNYLQFIDFLLSNTNCDTTICFILGSEIAYENEIESTYYDRAEYHKKLNSKIKNYSTTNSRIKYIELTKYIKSQSDFTNNINHFKPSVYYAFSKDVLTMINNLNCDADLPTSNYKRYFYKRYLQPIRARIPQPIINALKPLYRFIIKHK